MGIEMKNNKKRGQCSEFDLAKEFLANRGITLKKIVVIRGIAFECDDFDDLEDVCILIDKKTFLKENLFEEQKWVYDDIEILAFEPEDYLEIIEEHLADSEAWEKYKKLTSGS